MSKKFFSIRQVSAYTVGLLIITSAHNAAAQGFVSPTGWDRGDAMTTAQVWDVFSTASGATPDLFDNNPNGPASLTENTGTTIITSSNNIYSFSAATDFTVTVPVDDISDPEEYDLTAIVQMNAIGRQLAYDSVLLNGVTPSEVGLLQFGDVTGQFGGDNVTSWFLFELDYADYADGIEEVTDLELTFNASGSSMSLTQLIVDTALSPSSQGFFIEENPGLETITGDYNADGFVSQADLDLVLLNWGAEGLPIGFLTFALPDGPGFDGTISQNELDGVLLNWGNGTPPDSSVAAVPEPGALVMISTLALVARGRNRRRI